MPVATVDPEVPIHDAGDAAGCVEENVGRGQVDMGQSVPIMVCGALTPAALTAFSSRRLRGLCDASAVGNRDRVSLRSSGGPFDSCAVGE